MNHKHSGSKQSKGEHAVISQISKLSELTIPIIGQKLKDTLILEAEQKSNDSQNIIQEKNYKLLTEPGLKKIKKKYPKKKPEKLWLKMKPPYQVEVNGFTTKDINFIIEINENMEEEFWADASIYRPLQCELVTARTAKGKRIPVWWNGYQWEGYRLNDTDKVLFWKLRD